MKSVARAQLRIICAWCGRAKVDGQWVDGPAEDPPVGTVSHGMCPDCYEAVMERERPIIEALRRVQRQHVPGVS